MPITTKTGDQGTTGVAGKRVDKDSGVIEALGSLDELAAVVGLAAQGDVEIGRKINNDLYRIMAVLSGYSVGIELGEEIRRMEEEIGGMEEEIGKFQVPGEQMEVHWNWARTVCRRSERRLITLNKIQPIDPNILIYINRLSDYLFVLSKRFKK